jgi:hypothetical protein
MITGLLGTTLVSLGYLFLALRKEASLTFTIASIIWVVHAIFIKDFWLLISNSITTLLGLISVIRYYGRQSRLKLNQSKNC